jgi:hypothetical protein
LGVWGVFGGTKTPKHQLKKELIKPKHQLKTELAKTRKQRSLTKTSHKKKK